MGKRSNFERVEKDFYRTFDPRAVAPLLPHLGEITLFAEPCVGRGDLRDQLEGKGHLCVHESDLPLDALDLGPLKCEAIITNPPWTRKLLHEMIGHFVRIAPQAWLLFDANWAFTAQASPLLRAWCTDIVVVGRLLWIPGTTDDGKDDCAWYRFSTDKNSPIKFHGKSETDGSASRKLAVQKSLQLKTPDPN